MKKIIFNNNNMSGESSRGNQPPKHYERKSTDKDTKSSIRETIYIPKINKSLSVGDRIEFSDQHKKDEQPNTITKTVKEIIFEGQDSKGKDSYRIMFEEGGWKLLKNLVGLEIESADTQTHTDLNDSTLTKLAKFSRPTEQTDPTTTVPFDTFNQALTDSLSEFEELPLTQPLTKLPPPESAENKKTETVLFDPQTGKPIHLHAGDRLSVGYSKIGEFKTHPKKGTVKEIIKKTADEGGDVIVFHDDTTLSLSQINEEIHVDNDPNYRNGKKMKLVEISVKPLEVNTSSIKRIREKLATIDIPAIPETARKTEINQTIPAGVPKIPGRPDKFSVAAEKFSKYTTESWPIASEKPVYKVGQEISYSIEGKTGKYKIDSIDNQAGGHIFLRSLPLSKFSALHSIPTQTFETTYQKIIQSQAGKKDTSPATTKPEKRRSWLGKIAATFALALGLHGAEDTGSATHPEIIPTNTAAPETPSTIETPETQSEAHFRQAIGMFDTQIVNLSQTFNSINDRLNRLFTPNRTDHLTLASIQQEIKKIPDLLSTSFEHIITACRDMINEVSGELANIRGANTRAESMITTMTRTVRDTLEQIDHTCQQINTITTTAEATPIISQTQGELKQIFQSILLPVQHIYNEFNQFFEQVGSPTRVYLVLEDLEPTDVTVQHGEGIIQVVHQYLDENFPDLLEPKEHQLTMSIVDQLEAGEHFHPTGYRYFEGYTLGIIPDINPDTGEPMNLTAVFYTDQEAFRSLRQPPTETVEDGIDTRDWFNSPTNSTGR